LGPAVAEMPSPKDPCSMICGVDPSGMTMDQIGVKANASCVSYGASIPMYPEFLGVWTASAPATCGVGGQGRQSLAATLRFSDRQLGAFQPMCVLGCLRQNARTAVTTAVNGLKRNRSSPQKMRLKWGRWDRNRTCNLRFWRKRHCILPPSYPVSPVGRDQNSSPFSSHAV
jgi:hypothetical protein